MDRYVYEPIVARIPAKDRVAVALTAAEVADERWQRNSILVRFSKKRVREHERLRRWAWECMPAPEDDLTANCLIEIQPTAYALEFWADVLERCELKYEAEDILSATRWVRPHPQGDLTAVPQGFSVLKPRWPTARELARRGERA